MKKRMKKAIIIGSSICLILLIGAAVAFNIQLNDSTRIGAYDFTYLDSGSKQILQEYVNEKEEKIEISSSNIIIQNNQVFVFFDFKPLEGSHNIAEMSSDVIERNLFYGYAKIEKKFNDYNVTDFNLFNYDKSIGLEGASRDGTFRDNQYRCFGKILDNNVTKIEFYDDDTLAGAYYVGDKDYYFIELTSSIGNVNLRFYDKENKFLYQ